jgi:NAD(P)-dependent dehydrogenase (short-subunit alcohol dehydrogenase family)
MTTTSQEIAIVTGAASGIGRATAQALARAGYRVFGTSRKAGASAGNGVTMLTADVTDETSVAALVADVLSRAGRIDLLVNNAGLGIVGGAEESSPEQAKALFDVNFFGVLRMVNAVLPTMRKQKSGRIVNIGSVLGLIPSPYNAIYSASKHAIEGYTESLDHEVRAFGIRAVVVEPAYTNTPFEDNKVKPDLPMAIYDTVRGLTETLMQASVKAGDAPEIVAATVIEAVKAKAPKRRYPAGKMARRVRMLRSFVPEETFDKSLRKQSGLPV